MAETYKDVLTAEMVAKSLYRVKRGYDVNPTWEDIREDAVGSRYMKLGQFVIDLLNTTERDHEGYVLGDLGGKREVRLVLKGLVKAIDGLSFHYDYAAAHPEEFEEVQV